LTTAYTDPTGVREATLEVAKDVIAAGLDPEKAVFFIQSRVPHHAELAILLGMLTRSAGSNAFRRSRTRKSS